MGAPAAAGARSKLTCEYCRTCSQLVRPIVRRGDCAPPSDSRRQRTEQCGVVGYKTHCKMLLVVRREGGKLKRYTHLGTGNYHPGTARVYSDYGLLTASEDLGEDVHEIFMQITSLTKTSDLNLLFQSPFSLRDKLLELIRREAANASAGGTGHIIAKLNSLVEPEVIRALYDASAARSISGRERVSVPNQKVYG